jgi:hypothetical protein
VKGDSGDDGGARSLKGKLSDSMKLCNEALKVTSCSF